MVDLTPAEAIDVLTQCELLEGEIATLKRIARRVLKREMYKPKLRLVEGTDARSNSQSNKRDHL